jgi:virginiamycin B lyase
LIIDTNGIIWYAGNRNGHIGSFDPKFKKIRKFFMPEGIKDPHTLVFDSRQNIWFTAQHSNVIGHLDIGTGEVRFVTMERKGSRPYGIKVDSQGNAWSVLVGTNRLARVDPNMSLTEFDLPRKDARPRRLEITDDDNIWYVDYAGGYLSRFNTSTETITEWLMPSGKAGKPYATGLDGNSILWIFETGLYPNKMVSFDTKNEKFTSETIIKEGGLVRHTYYDSKNKTLWFGVDVGFIMSARVY